MLGIIYSSEETLNMPKCTCNCYFLNLSTILKFIILNDLVEGFIPGMVDYRC